MIEPVSRCNRCLRDITSKELTEWCKDKGRAWWLYQIKGNCFDCSEFEFLVALEEAEWEEEGVIVDGCTDDAA